MASTPIFPKRFGPGVPISAEDGSKLDQFFSNTNFSSENGITATASGTQGNSYSLTATLSRVTTVASGNDGVLLPPATAGAFYAIQNSGANTMTLFGSGSDTINGTAGATGISVTAGTMVFLVCAVQGVWIGVNNTGQGGAGAYTTLSVSSTLTASSNVTVASTLAAASNVTVAKTLTASSNATVASTLAAASNVTVAGTLTASSNATVASTLAAASNVTVANTLTASSNATVASTLAAASDATVASTLTASSNAVVTGTLAANSNMTVSRVLTASSNVTVASTLAVTSDVAASGNVTLAAGATSKTVGFYGGAGTSQRAAAAQATSTVGTASSTALDTNTKAAIIEIMNTLNAMSIWKGSA